jgi:hypothetical protein
VTEIGDMLNIFIRKIFLPNSLNLIRYIVFKSSNQLEEIVFSNLNIKIPYRVFDNCFKLKNIFVNNEKINFKLIEGNIFIIENSSIEDDIISYKGYFFFRKFKI